MDSQTWLAIIGTLLSVLGFWATTLLGQINKNQQILAEEVKEMNADIRELLTAMARSEERVKSLSERMDNLHGEVGNLSERILKLEQI